MASPELTVVTALDAAREAGIAEEGSDDEVVEALLVAARELMERTGIRRLRMDDVARSAGYGRATLYRRFATRDELVWAVVTREVARVLDAIEAATSSYPDLRDRLVEAFATTVEGVHRHTLLRRLLQLEPDLLLPHLTTGGADALGLARDHLARLLRQGRAAGQLGPIDVEVAADMVVRLVHSLLLTPGGPIPVEDPEALRRYADRHLVSPLLRLAGPP